MFDDSIITDTFQKKQDLAEVGVTMTVAEFRQKWYSESEQVAKDRAREVFTVASPN